MKKDLNTERTPINFRRVRKRASSNSFSNVRPDSKRPAINYQERINQIPIYIIDPTEEDPQNLYKIFGVDGEVVSRTTGKKVTIPKNIAWGKSCAKIWKTLRDVIDDRQVRPPSEMNSYYRKGFIEKHSLKGRGLRGAGVNHTKNLRDAVGASKMEYRVLGSKFIRLPDLHNNVLNIKHNNRTSAKNQFKMSDEMTKLVSELVFEGNINQKLYETLDHSEKIKFFKLLKLTHLYYSNKSILEDPNNRLIQEFNKLRGEVALGNDNPELIKELKNLLIDMHELKLINTLDFRVAMLHL
ncbi:uncharacterized protein PHALS_07194 [Plasmopara halstedii]|uniref:Uncharacterized protein n=1 Tax=Plasmopara halstedii TaxID=4781 RepID=A0A0P1B3T1_PLAHL|nr:uncharacterized protein PHALS_07194 [Plasmopara halstedii]CEG49430.1 hypothetical protein PHALS_07194 [Plasmopara halstedii]|eukprot:XP_024585799.1 hypothetical protein PHALS_07194 [Plasmopara halstedii]